MHGVRHETYNPIAVDPAYKVNSLQSRARFGRAGDIARKLRALIPTRDAARNSRALRWLGPLLEREWLWHLNRRTVASGAALGVFFGIIIPVAQMPFAAAGAILLRANLPVAMLSTLVSNPFTFGPIYWLAHVLGSSILDSAERRSSTATSATDVGTAELSAASGNWIERIMDIGAPLMLGLTLLAASGALLAYLAVRVVWRLQVVYQRQRRQTDDT